MFFQGRDEVHKSLRRLMKNLEKAGIPFAIVGGMAVFAHGHRRTTADVDVLLTPQGFGEFKRRYVGNQYGETPGRSRRFSDLKNSVWIDFLLTGLYPGSGRPGPVSFPDPQQSSVDIDGKPVVSLENLIQLKLAARRHQDFADVVNLIRVHDLDESFLPRLHPTLHRDFVECLDEKRREDEYEARNG